MKIQRLLSATSLIAVLFLSSCKKDEHIPPSLELKTGVDYTSEGGNIGVGTLITVGIIAEKKEDEMKTYNISYKYEGQTSTTSLITFNLTGDEQEHYDKDYQFSVGANAGTVTWYFVITDKDGNIAKKELTFVVQV